jgi:succinylglutamate desuccinylase
MLKNWKKFLIKMTKNKKTSSPVQSNRMIGIVEGFVQSPTVIILAGIHGNEKAGVKAANQVIHKIRQDSVPFQGNLYMILGNINALEKGIRYESSDLNRIWNEENIDAILDSSVILDAEAKEQIEIYAYIKDILSNNTGPFYFLDLHTTSSATIPFITISDSLNNRKFSSNFSIPIVLGIEEYLDGPLLTYINEFGHVALGFEGGEHHDNESIIKCEAFIWLALVYSKCIKKKNLPDFLKYKNELSEKYFKNVFFEIIYKYTIKKDENFKMHRGFKNFEHISKNQSLAQTDGKEIFSNEKGRIFMPLYQNLGDDGYFILNKISMFWLKASLVARKIKINHFLRLIPGVKIDPLHRHGLIVNPKIAKYMAKDIFHLFGYRKKIFKNGKVYFTKRDRKVKPL